MILGMLLRLLGLGRGNLRQHEAQLRAMSDRELADLGVGRSQIPSLLCDESWVRDVSVSRIACARPAEAHARRSVVSRRGVTLFRLSLRT